MLNISKTKKRISKIKKKISETKKKISKTKKRLYQHTGEDMNIRPNQKITSLPGYAFAEVDKKVQELKDKGITPIDFGVGDPQDPTPQLIREGCKQGVESEKSSGYPSYIGSAAYRKKIAEWNKKRFGIVLDPDKEICATIGAKEAVFNFPHAFLEPGDYVLVPNPGYPPYTRGTSFAGGKVHYMNLLPENGFLPDLESIPETIVKKAKIIWVNYPNNPTTAIATREFYEKLVKFCHKHDIIIASDEPYSENYYDKKPLSVLEIAKEGVIVFQSLSKRSNMTCYRVGWVAGDERIISIFKKLKTNVDSGCATFIQDAAITALSDEKHVEGLRADYRKKRDILIEALTSAGLPRCEPQGTIYMWQKVPEEMTSVEFAARLLDPKIGIVVTPGSWISSEVDGVNPGEGFVRFALVPSLDEVKKAAEKIRKLKF